MEPSDDGSGFRTVVLSPEDEQELMFAMDTPMTFAEWQNAVLRIACDWTDPSAALSERLAAVLRRGVAPAAAAAEVDGGDGEEDGSVLGAGEGDLSLGGALSGLVNGEVPGSDEVRLPGEGDQEGEGLLGGAMSAAGMQGNDVE